MRPTVIRPLASSAARSLRSSAPIASSSSRSGSSSSGGGGGGSDDPSSNLPSVPDSSESGPLLQRAAASILPPLPLYRRLLRAHRKHLTYEMRSLGDVYVKDEFRRHRAVTNPLQIVGFLGSWKTYLDELESVDSLTGEAQPSTAAAAGDGQDKGKKRYYEGRRLSKEEFDQLSEEQLYQLHDLMMATRDLYNAPPSASSGPPPPEPQSEGERVLQDILDSSAAAGSSGSGSGSGSGSRSGNGQNR
ncbi:unnamed protein product [Parajaminaea phylloscopi]